MHFTLTLEVDAFNHLRTWPEEARERFGADASAALGRSWVEVLDVRDRAGNRLCARSCGLHEMARRGEEIGVFEVLAPAADGEVLLLFVQARALGGATGAGLELTVWPDRREGSLERRRPTAASRPRAAASDSGPGRALSRREAEVLLLIASGHGTETISKRLRLSGTTVRNHVQNALAKLGASTRSEAVARAIRRGLI
jgi:DNA-binding CsgD family transcriptional regulator